MAASATTAAIIAIRVFVGRIARDRSSKARDTADTPVHVMCLLRTFTHAGCMA